jgi:predicted dehydrogenase
VVYTGDGTETPQVPKKNAYTEELRYFIDCVSAGRAPQRVTPAEAARAVEIAAAEIKSVKQKMPVALR